MWQKWWKKHISQVIVLLLHTCSCMCTYFIIEFEEMAANELKAERHIPPGEARILWRFIQDHGDNYKVLHLIPCRKKNCIAFSLRVVVRENRAGPKDGGRPISKIFSACDNHHIWLRMVAVEEIFCVSFPRLTTPPSFGPETAQKVTIITAILRR